MIVLLSAIDFTSYAIFILKCYLCIYRWIVFFRYSWTTNIKKRVVLGFESLSIGVEQAGKGINKAGHAIEYGISVACIIGSIGVFFIGVGTFVYCIGTFYNRHPRLLQKERLEV